jgi:hypothetical protein
MRRLSVPGTSVSRAAWGMGCVRGGSSAGGGALRGESEGRRIPERVLRGRRRPPHRGVAGAARTLPRPGGWARVARGMIWRVRDARAVPRGSAVRMRGRDDLPVPRGAGWAARGPGFGSGPLAACGMRALRARRRGRAPYAATGCAGGSAAPRARSPMRHRETRGRAGEAGPSDAGPCDAGRHGMGRQGFGCCGIACMETTGSGWGGTGRGGTGVGAAPARTGARGGTVWQGAGGGGLVLAACPCRPGCRRPPAGPCAVVAGRGGMPIVPRGTRAMWAAAWAGR